MLGGAEKATVWQALGFPILRTCSDTQGASGREGGGKEEEERASDESKRGNVEKKKKKKVLFLDVSQ